MAWQQPTDSFFSMKSQLAPTELKAYALFHWPTPTCPRTKVSGGYSAQGPGDTSHPWLVVGVGCPGPSEAKRFLGKQSCLHHLPAK